MLPCAGSGQGGQRVGHDSGQGDVFLQQQSVQGLG